MLRYYYASLALSISRIQLTFSLSAFFRLPSILKSVFVCLFFFLPLSASQHTPTTTLNPYRTITAFCCSSISALFFFCFPSAFCFSLNIYN